MFARSCKRGINPTLVPVSTVDCTNLHAGRIFKPERVRRGGFAGFHQFLRESGYLCFTL